MAPADPPPTPPSFDWEDAALVGPGLASLGTHGPWLPPTDHPIRVRLASNENPLGPSPLASKAAARAMTELHRYPDAIASRLRDALAERHDVPPDHVVVGNGSTELIQLLVRAFVQPGQTVVCPWPSFVMFRLAAQAANREVLTAPLRGYRTDLAALAALVDQRTKLVFVSNPNNPTGTYVTRRELSAFLDRIPPHVVVVLDEAYFEYVTAHDFPDGVSALRSRDRMVVLRTFSKVFGLAGARVGYAVMDPRLARFIHAVRGPYNVNAVAQAAAMAALIDIDHLERTQRMVRTEMPRLREGLAGLGFEAIPSQANFLCVQAKGPAAPVVEALRHRGVLVAPLDGYDLPQCFRCTVGDTAMNDVLLAALQDDRALDPDGTGTPIASGP
jgi:histidinol-phosphate aminotransferase